MNETWSYSRVDCFTQCPYKYKLRYIDRLENITVPEADNALVLGRAMHKGIECGVQAGIEEYYNSFTALTDAHENEIIKLEHWIPKVQAILPIGGEHEYELDISPFIGYLDYLVKTGTSSYALYDFKYSNNIDHYLKSPQLTLYAAFYNAKHLERDITSLYYVFIPKVQIRQKKDESLYQFRQRLYGELEAKEVRIEKVEYQVGALKDFSDTIATIKATTYFQKNKTNLCRWCDFERYCEQGLDYELTRKD